MNLRKEARDRECQVRLPGCNGDTSTTVLAHFRLSGISGLGLKSPDWLGAWACSSCHDLVDGRTAMAGLMSVVGAEEWNRTTVRLAHACGVFRTQQILFKEGKLK